MWLKQVYGIRRVPTVRGDTLRSIALRELSDATAWTDLAGLNNLLPPYIVDDIADVTSSRVLLAGSLISVPSPTQPVPIAVASDADTALLTDLVLVDGQLAADAGGDIETVTGTDNLKQALSHRLQTRPGELIAHPAYGCRVYEELGRGSGPLTMQLAAAYVARSMRSDPRVASTSQVTAVSSGDTIAVAGVAIAVDGAQTPVGATIGG